MENFSFSHVSNLRENLKVQVYKRPPGEAPYFGNKLDSIRTLRKPLHINLGFGWFWHEISGWQFQVFCSFWLVCPQ